MMSTDTFTGQVVADIVEVRFAFSGKISHLSKKAGDQVKKGEILARLDKQILQTELDRELADYEKARAEFEIFVAKQGEPANDIARFEKARIQAQLNVSVKAVELAKAKLDQADLFSPVNGVVVDDNGNRVGMNVTPASNSYKILDTDSLRFRIEINSDQTSHFAQNTEVIVEIGSLKSSGHSKTPVFDGKKWLVDTYFDKSVDFFTGMSGILRFSQG